MKMSKFYSFLLIFLNIFLVESSRNNCDKGPSTNGMGTVLFTAADVYKQCWSPDEIAILTTRMILEDILPEVTILKIDSNAFIDDIVDYFRLLIEVVKATTQGRKRHITLLALTDLLGGYLQFAVLPIARHAFYAGHVDFTSMVRIIQLFEELKWFLRTNGQGWSRPIESKPMIIVEPINLLEETPKGDRSCCDRLIFYENERRKETNCSATQMDVFFPMPFFDSKVRPTSIAVPFRRFALRNIESRKASYFLLKFFISAMQCMKDKRSGKEAIIKFQNNLFSFIEKEVVPKLNDDKFYSAFGGILRVEETLKALGARANTETTCAPEPEEEVGSMPATLPQKSSKSTIVIVVMLVTIILWFFLGTAFICYRIRKNQSKEKSPKPKKPNYNTTSSGSSKWSLFSKSSKPVEKSEEGSQNYSPSQTSKTTPYTSSLTSEYEAEERKKEKTYKSPITVCYPPYTVPYGKSTSKPAVIETKTTMKKLPSISEITEVSTIDKEGKTKASKVPIGEPLYSSSKDDVRRVNFSRRPSIEISPIPCPKHAGTSFSTSRTLNVQGKDVGVQPSADKVHIDECWCDLYNAHGRGRSKKKGVSDHILEKRDEALKSALIPEDLWTPEESGSTREQTTVEKNGTSPNASRSHHASKSQNASRGQTASRSQTASKSQNASSRSQTASRNQIGEKSIKRVDQSRSTELEQEEDEDYSEVIPSKERSQEIPTSQTSNENKGAVFSSEPSVKEYFVAEEESATEKSAAENYVLENGVPESTDDTATDGPGETSPHIFACHSSLTGAYATPHQVAGQKHYIFGYDFQTSSSSDISDEETDMKTSTSK